MRALEPDSYVEPYIFNMVSLICGYRFRFIDDSPLRAQATLSELDSGSAIRRKVDILERAASATGEVIKVSGRAFGVDI